MRRLGISARVVGRQRASMNSTAHALPTQVPSESRHSEGGGGREPAEEMRLKSAAELVEQRVEAPGVQTLAPSPPMGAATFV